jgi:hypothetical protein
MDCIPDLNEAVAHLATVIEAGLLNDLKESIAYARRRRPRSDFDAFPGLRQAVENFADLLNAYTGLPRQLCKLAALNHFHPRNRDAVALATLRAFADEIREGRNHERASTILAAERRRGAS